jgi:hypothetical protein
MPNRINMGRVMKLAAILARSLPILVATGLLLTGSQSFGLGGGEVDFENFSNSLIYTNSVHNGPATGLISGTPGVVNPFQHGAYVFALFSAPTNQTTVDASLSGWTSEATCGVNTAIPGYMNGNDDPRGPGCTLAISLDGETRNFLVVGWSANVGISAGNPSECWGNAVAWWNNGSPTNGVVGWFGISDIAQDVVVGGGGIPVPTIFGPTPGYEVQGFTLNKYDVVPEPSTFALAGLGAAALLAFRRRTGLSSRARAGAGRGVTRKQTIG